MSRVYITVAEHVDATLPILSQEWRAAHCVEGDKVLRMAAQVLFSTQPAAPEIDVRDLAMVLTAIAQAHYAAANVRAKPSAQPVPRHAGADGWCPDYGSRVDPCPPGCASGTCVYGGDKVGS